MVETLPTRRTRLLGVAGALSLGMAVATVPAPAAASIVDAPHFKTLGMIIVWGGSDAGVPIVSDFILDTSAGSADQDLIQPDNVQAVVTGSLVPLDAPGSSNQGAPVRIRRIAGGGRVDADSNGDDVLDINDSFGSFGIGNNTDYRTRRMELNTSFYVASNAPFSIDASATPVGSTTLADLDDVRGTLSVTLTDNDGIPFGSAAQFPHTGGTNGGRRMNRRRLSSMSPSFNVFNGNQATAASRGTIAEQSVRFDINYRYNFGVVDLSQGVLDVEAEVVYTLYMP